MHQKGIEGGGQKIVWLSLVKTHGRNMVCSHADLVARGELEDGSKVGDVELF